MSQLFLEKNKKQKGYMHCSHCVQSYISLDSKTCLILSLCRWILFVMERLNCFQTEMAQTPMLWVLNVWPTVFFYFFSPHLITAIPSTLYLPRSHSSSFSVGPPGVSILPTAHAINEHASTKNCLGKVLYAAKKNNYYIYTTGFLTPHSNYIPPPTEILLNQYTN